jgi:hypothetical protein
VVEQGSPKPLAKVRFLPALQMEKNSFKIAKKIDYSENSLIGLMKKHISVSEAQGDLLEKTINELVQLKTLVYFVLNLTLIAVLVLLLKPYFVSYIFYVTLLFDKSSNDAKLHLVAVIPATAILTLLLQKIWNKLFK